MATPDRSMMTNATLRVPYMEIGRLRRRELLRIFATAQAGGCSVDYHEDRGFLDSLYTGVVVSGPEFAVKYVATSLSYMWKAGA